MLSAIIPHGYDILEQPIHTLRKRYISVFQFIMSSYYCVQGELEHRRVKWFYARTNRQGFERQISRHERRTAKLQIIKKKLADNKLVDDNDEDLPQSDPSEHYHISKSCKVHFDITKWLVDNKEDQAVKVCFVVFDSIFKKN